MKYFSLSYWFKIWLLTAQLINNQTKGITAKAINNKKSNKITTVLNWQNQELNFANTTMQTILNDSSKLKQTVNQRNNHFHQNYLDKQSSANILSLELEINLQKQQQNRKKRLEPSDKSNFKKMAFVTPLEISNVNITYGSNILWIIDTLQQHHILEEIFARDNIGASANIVPDTIYESNNSQYDYFIIPIVYEDEGNNVWLVFSVSNIYLQGFLINNDYYYFRDAELVNFVGISVGQPSEIYNSIALRFTGHYSQLWTQRLQNRDISWQNIVVAFNNLRNYNNNNEYYQIIRESLV